MNHAQYFDIIIKASDGQVQLIFLIVLNNLDWKVAWIIKTLMVPDSAKPIPNQCLLAINEFLGHLPAKKLNASFHTAELVIYIKSMDITYSHIIFCIRLFEA